ncbi:THUMP domain-containing protein 3 isoform X2 [Lampris incognitus]|uniref:THUMP domain-containing protein 3 isoform X2 n=1 Tax=Lampris incognitus TaxID=2546036 RepID=UPI0024B5C234|nr:THUMP domain-containing protein 3 isoform X2 [Lampris incognitus]
MSSEAEADPHRGPTSSLASTGEAESGIGAGIVVTVGATVPTGFEHTAAEEIRDKIGADARISKNRGRIYFQISTDKLAQVHLLRSVDNLFVVVEEFEHYQFQESKEETLTDLQQLASKLSWTNALEVWRLNNCLKKKRGRRRGGDGPKGKPNGSIADAPAAETAAETAQESPGEGQAEEDAGLQELEETQPEAKPIKFRVTCSRAGDKHSFSSNEAARDFGGAVEELFHWKADMTKFDIEVLLNIHNEEVVIGIALTEESLHRRNITHFGPTTLRSTLCYGMLRMGSRKKNWDLYPSCLREMARVCKPGSGKAVLLTQDKKCFAKAISRMGGLWRKLHTVWVNVGGLHAGVYLLKRTDAVFGRVPEDVHQSQASFNTAGEEEEKEGLSPS